MNDRHYVIDRLAHLASNGSLVFGPDSAGTVLRLVEFLPNLYASVFDADGTYVWACPSLQSLRPPEGFVGLRLDEIGSSEWARERVAAIRSVIQSRTPILYSSIFMGRHLLGAMIPLSAVPDETHVLSVAVVADDSAPERRDSSEGGAVHVDLPMIQFSHVSLGSLSNLTRRQIETLRHVAIGKTNDEIAADLHRTRRLVEWHVRMLLKETGARDRMQLCRIGRVAGLHLLDEESLNMILAKHSRERELETASRGP